MEDVHCVCGSHKKFVCDHCTRTYVRMVSLRIPPSGALFGQPVVITSKSESSVQYTSQLDTIIINFVFVRTVRYVHMYDYVYRIIYYIRIPPTATCTAWR